MPNGKLQYRRAFTLIEILVVISIIALLVAIIVPTVARSRENARSVVCRSNLREWGKAIQMYVSVPDHKNVLPFEERPDPRPETEEDVNGDRVWDPTEDDERGWVCWFDVLDRYFGVSTADEGVKVCPTVSRSDPDREESYRMNSKLADSSKKKKDGSENPYYKPYRKLNTLKKPKQTVLLFDGDIGKGDVPTAPPSFKGRWRLTRKDDVNYRHLNKTNVLFTDWHVENIAKKDMKDRSVYNQPIVWQPADMGEWEADPQLEDD